MTGRRGCAQDACPAHASAPWGLCERHYRRKLHYRRDYGYVDAAPVRAHLTVLRNLGWTWQQIGDAAGQSSATPHSIYVNRYRQVRAVTARQLLAVPPVPALSHRGQDATGARRRLQALQWMGWPMSAIAARLGRPPGSVSAQMYRGSMSARLVHDISTVYEQLAHLPGPSAVSATKARRSGYASPWAWDDTTIDDPTAGPDGALTDGVAS